ncbi:tyrosine-protein kinase receptor Tie-1-like [Acropora millepora]|uniref:tyrosine-protein kinase receptor Tie-1-like n=1 Tax=Acropora millepora TaxID=45264 RepID=UPI001CF0D60B|nr:tyrosine-protein kinase receptor Tie-1-like [Acropora millepora]XP_044180721.1 tyrosine-protein kinase receptor Tie-1-like [Acropora millepora]
MRVDGDPAYPLRAHLPAPFRAGARALTPAMELYNKDGVITGVVLYEIFTIGGSPYPRTDGRKVASLLQEGYRMQKVEHVDNKLYQIMMNCWQSEPQTRPSFAQLTQKLKRMENQHKILLNMLIYDNALYANLEDLNA